MKKLVFTALILVLLYYSVGVFLRIFPNLNNTVLGVFWYSFIFYAFILIVINIFLFPVFLAAKDKSSKLYKISILTSSALAFSIILFPLIYLAPKEKPTGSYDMRFSEVLWQDSTQQQGNEWITYRQKMVGDLIDNILPGKTLNKIEMLLGQPLNKVIDGKDRIYLYKLGHERDGLITLDTEILEVIIDEHGLYKKSHIEIY